MANTSTGHVYKIVCSKSNDVYVGSTFNALRTRMSQHKVKFNRGSGLATYRSFKLHGWGSLHMMLIASYQVVDRNHLMMYETLWINKLKSINKKIPFKILTERMISKPKLAIKAMRNKAHATKAFTSVEATEQKEQAMMPDMTRSQIEQLRKDYYELMKRNYGHYQSPTKLPPEAEAILQMEKHPIIALMLKQKGVWSLQDMIDHDTKILQSRK